MRAEKIVNMLLELPLTQQLGGYLAVRYEDLVVNGTRYLLEQVAAMLGLDALPEKCKLQQPEPWRLGKRKIDPGLRNWISDHLVQEVEALLDYPYIQP
jgi:hypothetical protein